VPNNPEQKLSSLIEEEEKRRLSELPNKSEPTLPLANARYVGTLESKRCITWLSRAAKYVESAIHEFWSSIIFAHATRLAMWQKCSPTDTAGDQNDSELRFGNVVSFAPTAIDFILRNNWSTMAIRMSSGSCAGSMSDTISESRTEHIIEGLKAGTLDFEKVTMAEWLQVSFLMLYHGQETQINQNIVYGGSVFNLHACVTSVHTTAGSLEELKRVQ